MSYNEYYTKKGKKRRIRFYERKKSLRLVLALLKVFR